MEQKYHLDESELDHFEGIKEGAEGLPFPSTIKKIAKKFIQLQIAKNDLNFCCQGAQNKNLEKCT